MDWHGAAMRALYLPTTLEFEQVSPHSGDGHAEALRKVEHVARPVVLYVLKQLPSPTFR